LAWHTAAGLAVIGFVLAYFWYYKGLYDLFDVLFGYNAAYARQWATDWPTAKAMTIDWFRRGSWFYGAFLVAWIAGLVMARRTGDTESRRGLSWAMALFLLSYVSMASQRKFFGYHWGVTAPFAALLAAWAVVAFVRRAPFVAYATALSLLVVGLVTAPPWYARRETSYRSYAGAFVGYLRGTLRREEFIDQFTGVYGYVYRAQEAIGEAIRERAVAGDTLLVDGFEPTVYIVSGLRCPCRFFVSHHLADERLVYKHRARWIERQEEQLARRPPRFFVTFSEQQLGTRGYRLLRRELHHFLGERIY
jgi:hypothetical protein